MHRSHNQVVEGTDGRGGGASWSLGVAGTELGDALTANILAMGLGAPVMVKVLSCTR